MYGALNENNEVKNAIKIPYALSILAFGDPTAEVIGLNEFPAEETPPLIVHYYFDLMVTIGVFMIVISLIFWIGIKRGWTFIKARWYRWLIVLGGPLSFLAIEAGWWMAEVGRQPWILNGIMTVEEAATSNKHVGLMSILFLLLYIVLGIGTIVVLRRIFKDNPVEKELEPLQDGDNTWH